MTGPLSLPAGAVLNPYTLTCTVTGGTGGYVWTASGLPSGLTMSPAGVISGTPKGGTEGSYLVQITVRDSSNATQSRTLPLLIRTSPVFSIPVSAQTAHLNVPYGPTSISVTGGTPPYSIAMSGLPPGIVADGIGTLRGTPTALGGYIVNVEITDVHWSKGTGMFTMSVTADPVALSILGPASLPLGREGASYGPVTFTASGGTAPLTWSASGLPLGVGMSSSGVISGTSVQRGSYTVSVTVRDQQNRSATATLPLTIEAGPLTVSARTLPSGFAGVPYGPQFLYATGGVGPYTWTGTGPAWATVSADGKLSGIPPGGSAGTYSIQVTVRDSTGATASGTFTLTIEPGQSSLKITSPATILPSGMENVSYAAVEFAATGGTGEYTWSATGVPSGLILSGRTLLGRPAWGTVGTHSIQVTLRDSWNATAVSTFSLTINAGLRIIGPSSLPKATVGVAIAPVSFTAAGGTAPYTWAASGTPSGMSMSAAGVLSGTPVSLPGTYGINVAVTDAAGRTAEATVMLVVETGRLPLQITGPLSLPTALIGSSYGPIYFAADGGTIPYTWKLIGGALPGGLDFSPFGQLGGKPAAGTGGSYPLSAQVTDSAGATASIALTLTVQASASSLTITTSSLPDGAALNQYGPARLTAAGGSGIGYVWSATGLPQGLSLTTDGVLSGAPGFSAAGTYQVTITVLDSAGGSARATLPMLIRTAPVCGEPWPPSSAQVGVTYGPHTISVHGGLAPYTFLVTGDLPNGMSLSQSGVLGGTPASDSAGYHSIGFRITDSLGYSSTCAIGITVTGDLAPLAITGPSVLPAAQEQVSYAPVIFTASGGTGGRTWNVTGLPSGLTLTTAGILSGTPEKGSRGAYTLAVTVRDAASRSATVSLALIVNAGSIIISPSVLPSGQLGVAYGPVTLSATGGTPPYSFTAGSALPNGLSLSAAGLLSGTPAPGSDGNHTFTVSVRDAAGVTASATWLLFIQASPLAIAPISQLPSGREQMGYPQVTFSASGGAGGYTWTATGLPTGLSLSQSGVLGGSPAHGTHGTYSVQITVRDASLKTASLTLPLTINTYPQLGFAPPLPPGQVGVPYNFVLTATAGIAPYTWVATSSLPQGLTLSTAGVLSGTPTTAGSFHVAIRITDALEYSMATSLAITIARGATGLAINVPASFPTAVETVAYSGARFTASGGSGGYQWSALGLPSGLAMHSATTGEGFGIVNGTPAEGTRGLHNVQVSVRDSSGATASLTLTLLVESGQTLLITSPASLGPYTESGANMDVVFQAHGGTPPYTWSATNLPPGLTFSATGVLRGAPAERSRGAYTARFTVEDSKHQTASVTIAIVVNGPVQISGPATLPPAVVGSSYGPITFTATGGSTPYMWNVIGSLPQGLALSLDGVLSGTPAAGSVGSHSITVQVNGFMGTSARTNFTFIVQATASSIRIGGPSSLPPGQELAAFGPIAFSASGGSGAYVWSATGLPAGLHLSADGVLGGSPASGSRGAYRVQVTVRDTGGDTASTSLDLVIEAPALVVSPSSLPVGVTGSPYGPVVFTATRGQPPYSWTALSGVPTGLALSPGGTLSGTPVSGSAGAYILSIQVTDANRVTTSTRLALTITSPRPVAMRIDCTPSGPVTSGTPYSSTCAVTGGTAPYYWSLIGSLPQGLTFNPVNGSVSGTPIPSGSFSFTIKATDSSQPPLMATQGFVGSTQPFSFSLSTRSLSFSARLGTIPPPQTVSLTPAGFAYSVAVTRLAACGWLRVSPQAGEAPAVLHVGADPAGLAPGTYNCDISVSVGSTTQFIAVALAVNGSTLAASPASAIFRAEVGSAAPPPQTIAVTALDGESAEFSATAGCSWLDLQQTGTSTPGSLTLSVRPAGLAPNTYTCPIVIKAPAAISVPSPVVTLRVNPANLTVAPEAIALRATQGSAVPVVSLLRLTGPEVPVAFSARVTTASGGNWLSADAAAGVTPAIVQLQASPFGLLSGSYSASVHITFAGGEVTVPVTFTVAPVTFRLAPSTVTLRVPPDTPPAAQMVSVVFNDGLSVPFTLQPSSRLRTSPGTAATNFSVSPQPGLAPGVYTDDRVVVIPLTTTIPTQTLPVTIIVEEPPPAPALRISDDRVTFSLVQGAPAATQLLVATNQGASWTPAVTANASGGDWLNVSVMGGETVSGAPVAIGISADPSKVLGASASGQAGIYSGEIAVSDTATRQIIRVPVTMAVNPLPAFTVSRQGLAFTAVKAGSGAPQEVIDILNGGLRPLNWTATAATLSGGAWLKLVQSKGLCPGGLAAHVGVQVDPSVVAGMAPGAYYGSIELRGADDETGQPAINSPQTIAVVLNVLPEVTQVSPVVRPAGLIFSGAAGSVNVPAQAVTIYSAGASTVRYAAAVATEDGSDWCAAAPATAALSGSAPLGVQASFAKLPPGLHRCTINVSFSDGGSQAIQVTAIVTEAGAPVKAAMLLRHAAGDCDASGLVVSQRAPSGRTATTAFQPVGLEVEVRDPCGQPVDDAAVSVSFSIPDPSVALRPVGNGVYRGSWTPASVPRNLPEVDVLLQATAQAGAGARVTAGTGVAASVTVRLGTQSPPVIAPNGVADSINPAVRGRVAPCGWITIFGENLAESAVAASEAPLPLELQGLRLFLGGKPLPIAYAAPGQINAQVPCEIETNSEQNLWVVRGAMRSLPVNVMVASAQPSILPVTAGSGQAAAYWTDAAGNYALADPANPAGEGDLLAIYATGLGAVSPPVPAGAQTPTDVPSTTLLPVSASVGGMEAAVESAGLLPGSTGVYVVRLRLPAEIVKDDAAPLTITVDGYASQPGMTVAVR